ncbi:hypothetical protein F2Q70_00039258 [Brassica cretica]|uniref:Uncharacterized protein n=1 Tax=Brassica cretica TaxID=69181 RepID=A0A8S9KDB9_BRACR|nr:hypothetical protein F2Q70_00039258 [Brassica cretica]
MAVSTWPDISHLSISKPELVNVLRQMDQQVKWPQKMKAPDSFRNPGLWCDFHRDHGHKTEDCVALRIEVTELLKKGYLREFLSEKAKGHLNKETPGKPVKVDPASPPRHDRVIHVISGGSKISGLHSQGAREVPSPTARRPGHIAHCSKFPGKMDIGGQWELQQYHLPNRISGSRVGRKRPDTENNPTHRIQRRSLTDRWRSRPPSVFSDSQLIINQVQGEYQEKDDSKIQYLVVAQLLI